MRKGGVKDRHDKKNYEERKKGSKRGGRRRREGKQGLKKTKEVDGEKE